MATEKAFQLVYRQGAKGTIYAKLNFTDVANKFADKGLGFGVERVDFARGTRKTIQQTMGTINPNSVDDNFYVDTWWTSPPRVVLAGVVEIPAGIDDTFQVGYILSAGNTNQILNKSFLGVMEDIFKKNSHPLNIKNGDCVEFHDYNRREYYRVSLKNFNTSASVERPNLVTFTLEMDVLKELIDKTTNSGAKAGYSINPNALFGFGGLG